MPDLTVHFATNREETKGKIPFGPALNPKSPLYLRYGSADVAPPTARRGEYVLRRVRVEPESIPGVNAAAGSAPVLGSQAAFDGLRGRLIENKADLVLLLHGYASDFEMALLRAAEIKDRWSTPARPLEVAVFSWPADGTMVPLISYARDRDDARSSAKAIARALLRLTDYIKSLPRAEYCNASMHLVAHSMGNYALRHAFQALASDLGGKIPRLFQNIFLMAADEDNDTFEDAAKMQRLPDMAQAVHVYFARNDRALTISDLTKNNPDRLGSTGPRTLSGLPQKVTLIDCTAVASTASSEANHQYYRSRPEVILDVQAVLAGAAPDRIEGRSYVADKRAFRIAVAA